MGKAAGTALAELLAPQFGQLVQFLPQMVAQGVAQALSQVLVRTKRFCSKCLAARIAWEAAHTAEMEAAFTAAAVAAGILAPGGALDKADPRLGQLDIGPHLPDHLKLGSGTPHEMPPLLDAVTIAAGDEVCALHLPGVPQQPGRRQILVATPGMNVATAARLASQG
jgi:hypothetical protein